MLTMFEQGLNVTGELQALIMRADGTHQSITLSRDISWWKEQWLRYRVYLPWLSFGAFIAIAWAHPEVLGDGSGPLLGLVTTAGANYMAADFLSGSSSRINAFNQHDCGTGTNAAAVGDTALQTPAGTARVAGTQSNPTANQYRTVATIPFTSSLAITEWGLFSASSAGTLWDRRVFAAINVANGDSIQFTYTLTVPSGGS
jgi:hypothetical protein